MEKFVAKGGKLSEVLEGDSDDEFGARTPPAAVLSFMLSPAAAAPQD